MHEVSYGVARSAVGEQKICKAFRHNVLSHPLVPHPFYGTTRSNLLALPGFLLMLVEIWLWLF